MSTDLHAVYWLAVAGRASDVSLIAAIIMAALTVVLVVVGGFFFDVGPKELGLSAFWWSRRMAVGAIASALVAVFVPPPEALIRSYVMIEGSKLVTSDNAAAVAKDVGGKLDVLIDALARRIDPARPPAEAPAGKP